ncbi:MAG: hypothetical protein ABI614_08940, partial [Planctomycetota bacterium]
MDDLPIIALRTASSTKESLWRKLLAGMNCTVLAGTDLTANHSPIDIVITDRQEQFDARAPRPPLPETYGVIGIGAELAADVVFSDEPTERELQLACDLLCKIVRLRREHESSRQTQLLLTEMAELDGLTGLA